MIINTIPPYWNSAHRPIEFIYDYERRFSFVTDTDGFVTVNSFLPLTFTPEVGDKIYIEDGVFEGTHTIASVGTFELVTETASSTSTTYLGFFRQIRIPEIKLYSGYNAGEEYPAQLPLTLVATFTPENSPDNDVRFDVSEYLKSIFSIQPPVEGIDFNMFNRFRLFFDDTYKEFFQVLNSSIKTSLLMSDYANTGNPLNTQQPPIIFSCGRTIVSYLENNVVENVVSVDDDITQTEGDYSAEDYASADYYTN